jgi:hypothetical protein
MAQIELDTAKTCNFSAIDKFYENNLNNIVKLDSSTSSIYSSTESIENVKRETNRGGSTTASDSESECLELDSVPRKEDFIKHQSSNALENKKSDSNGNLVVVNHANSSANGPKIDSIAIQNSSDIQFGNKTFYNGPVTIKQFMLDDKNKKWISRNTENAQLENGVVNKAFDGKLRCLLFTFFFASLIFIYPIYLMVENQR